MLIAHIIGPSGNAQRCVVCLDTGADACTLPLTYAALLGLDQLKMPMHMTGGCGSMANPTYYADIEIQIRFNVNSGPEQVASFKTYAGFTPGMDAQGIGLLGGVGFFENFPTAFDHKNKLFHITLP